MCKSGHPCHFSQPHGEGMQSFVIKYGVSCMLLIDVLYGLEKFRTILGLSIIIGVSFFQILSLHLLKLSYGFSSSVKIKFY